MHPDGGSTSEKTDSESDANSEHTSLYKLPSLDDDSQNHCDPETQSEECTEKWPSNLNETHRERPETDALGLTNSDSNDASTLEHARDLDLVLERGLSNIGSHLLMQSRSTFQLAKGVERCASTMCQLATRMLSCQEEMRHTNVQISHSLQCLLDLIQSTTSEAPDLSEACSAVIVPPHEHVRTRKRRPEDFLEDQSLLPDKKSRPDSQ